MTSPSMRPNGSIGFRLDATFHALLDERARRHRTSLGREAQRIVIEALSTPAKESAKAAERLRLRDEVSRLQGEVEEVKHLLRMLRGDLASTAAALLARDAPATVEEARAWVSETFRPSRDTR